MNARSCTRAEVEAGLFRHRIVEQGAKARRDGLPRDANPYKYTPNGRQGDVKRAYWERGWRGHE